MARKRKSTPPNQDAELLAIWMHSACGGDEDRIKALRLLTEKAMRDARWMYNIPEDEERQDGLEPHDDFGVIEALTKFLSKFDEMERQRKEDTTP